MVSFWSLWRRHCIHSARPLLAYKGTLVPSIYRQVDSTQVDSYHQLSKWSMLHSLVVTSRFHLIVGRSTVQLSFSRVLQWPAEAQPYICSRIIATPDWPTSGPRVLDTACTASGVVQCEGHRGEGWIKVSRGHHCEQERQSCWSAHYIPWYNFYLKAGILPWYTHSTVPNCTCFHMHHGIGCGILFLFVVTWPSHQSTSCRACSRANTYIAS